jgi:hypothetical protein
MNYLNEKLDRALGGLAGSFSALISENPPTQSTQSNASSCHQKARRTRPRSVAGPFLCPGPTVTEGAHCELYSGEWKTHVIWITTNRLAETLNSAQASPSSLREGPSTQTMGLLSPSRSRSRYPRQLEPKPGASPWHVFLTRRDLPAHRSLPTRRQSTPFPLV